ncbi:MAG TPA: acetamidase/formamidase family protein [Solirubrobacteraceae bacterium]|nr:acetamidase/formamidase family protein [Solirubrobacteraceae bacterium]
MTGRSIHEVRADAFSYVWDNALEPALEIEPGTVVEMHARDASDEQIRRGSTADDVASIDFTHVNPVSGPVFVKGANPGDVLAVELLEFRPGDWGWTAIIPGFGLLADDFQEPWLRISEIDGHVVRFSDRVELPLRPFPGTIGVAPAEPGDHPILPQTRWGGNLDTRHLTVGSTLYLPVGVEGALLSIGDTHAAQGDGEVCGTAVESAMDVSVRVTVRRDFSLQAPQFDAAGWPYVGAFHVCTGVGPDLLGAAADAVRAMITWLGEQHGIEHEEAYALVGVACDLRIHEVVDAPNWVVGAWLPEEILKPAAAAG